MKTSISSTSLARHLGEYLARVKYRSEGFLVTKNEDVVAELIPSSTPPRATWGQLAATLSDYPTDPGFAEDLEVVNDLDKPPENPWD